MSTFRTAFLPMVDYFRGALDEVFDMRRYDVALVVNAWSGAYPGAPSSTKTPTVTPLTVGPDGSRLKVTQVSQRDIIASGGLYQEMDLKIGPFTPPFVDDDGNPGGTDPSVFDIPEVGANTEIFFRITGPGMIAGGAYYKKVGQTLVSGNFHYFIVLRATANQNP